MKQPPESYIAVCRENIRLRNELARYKDLYECYLISFKFLHGQQWYAEKRHLLAQHLKKEYPHWYDSDSPR